MVNVVVEMVVVITHVRSVDICLVTSKHVLNLVHTVFNFTYSAKCNPGEMSDCCERGQNYPQYNKGSRCGKMITIHGNERSTMAQVVDECDSMHQQLFGLPFGIPKDDPR